MSDIAVEKLTTVDVDGTGVFDKLMKATKNHLDIEYKSGRIKGAEYAQVYLGSIVAVMDQAVKFLTAEREAELTDAQIELMLQKIKTEKAQIEDVVDGVPVLGVIGKQKTLYTRQADGFLRDAEHKMAKLMADVWAVQRTTDEGFAPSTQLRNNSIDSVISKAKQGVGA